MRTIGCSKMDGRNSYIECVYICCWRFYTSRCGQSVSKLNEWPHINSIASVAIVVGPAHLAKAHKIRHSVFESSQCCPQSKIFIFELGTAIRRQILAWLWCQRAKLNCFIICLVYRFTNRDNQLCMCQELINQLFVDDDDDGTFWRCHENQCANRCCEQY